MGTPDNVGGEVEFSEFICDVDIRGREVAEERWQRFVDAVSRALARLAETDSAQSDAFEVEVLCSRGVRGDDLSAALSRSDFRRVSMYVWSKPV